MDSELAELRATLNLPEADGPALVAAVLALKAECEAARTRLAEMEAAAAETAVVAPSKRRSVRGRSHRR